MNGLCSLLPQVCQEESVPDCNAKLLLIMKQRTHSVKAKRGKSVVGLWSLPPQVYQEEASPNFYAKLLLIMEQKRH